VTAIRERFNRRRQASNGVESLIRRLLGIDAKLRQYAEGRRFVQAVVDQVGMAGFNRVWTSPQTLPTLAELADHEAWIARVVAPGS
jgi:putative hydrolase